MDETAKGRMREGAALALLAEIATGALSPERFTSDARWWWNGGLDLPVLEFSKLLGSLHAQMASGIAIAPGLVLAQDDMIVVEATTQSPLKDGRIYDNRYLFLFQFAGDRIARVREYSDSAHVLATFDLAGG